MRFSKSFIPDFLDMKGRGHNEDRQLVREATGGDPSRFKLNHVMIVDETVRQIDACLRSCGYGVEYLKIFSGKFDDREPELPEIIAACRSHNVIPCIGGGMTERAMRNGTLSQYSRTLQRLGIDTIEVSNSYGDMPVCDERTEIRSLTKDFRRVLIEIGSKSGQVHETRDAWLSDLDTALELDPAAIILEGTGSGRSGIYDTRGRANSILVSELQERAGGKSGQFLVEAPYESQRDFWVKQLFGWRVRLGNIPLDIHTLQATDRLRLDAMPPSATQAVADHRVTHAEFRKETFEACEQVGLDTDTAIFHPGLHNVTADIIDHDPNWRTDLRHFIAQLKEAAKATIGRPHVIRVPSSRVITIEDLIRMMFGR